MTSEVFCNRLCYIYTLYSILVIAFDFAIKICRRLVTANIDLILKLIEFIIKMRMNIWFDRKCKILFMNQYHV